MGTIQPIVMPKWGLAMQDGMVARWDADEGEIIALGQEFMEIETTKITNVFESPVSGTLRKIIAGEGETLPVGALIGVVADDDVSDEDIGKFVEKFQSEFVPPESADDIGPEPQFVEIGDGRRIRYLGTTPEPGSDQTPAIFIHGFGADHTSWLFNQADIGSARPTYAIDLPGHGGSTKHVGAGDIEVLVRDTVVFMDAIGVDRAHMVGHSLGGATALGLAGANPDRVASLSLIAPAGLGPEISIEFIDGFIGQGRARKLRAVLEDLVENPALITAEMTEQVLRFKRLDGVEEALRAISAGCFAGGTQNADLRDLLRHVSFPVTIIWGRGDKIIPHTHAEGFGDSIEVALFDNAGHLPHMERSTPVNERLHAVMSGTR